jgi:hypothetical protein
MKVKENHTDLVNPKFWTISRKFKIINVQTKMIDDNDSSDYSNAKQHSKPDQIKSLIIIKSSFPRFRYTVKPKIRVTLLLL